MDKMSFEFHAISEELIEVIKDSVLRYDLYVVSIQLFPKFACKLIRKEEISKKNKDIVNSRMIVLYNYEPNLLIEDYTVFFNQNLDGIIFEIGRLDSEKLQESRISIITGNKDILKICKYIVKRFRDTMLKGAWVINPNNGAKEYYKNHCYTILSKELFETGIKIKAYAGWCEYILNEEII